VTVLGLRCQICGIEVTLSGEPSVMVEEIQVFSAAHNSHDEGTGFEILSDDESDADAG
jgi:hypothetical protein